jgi:putative salt-induced outer membrane protein YdiY
MSCPHPASHPRRCVGTRLRTRIPSNRTFTLLSVVAAFLTPAVAPSALDAQEDPGAQWRSSLEFTYLVSGGNSGASTLGLRSSARRASPTGELRLDLTGLRTDATRVIRTAVGTSPEDFQVERTRDRQRSAERYGVRTRYDRNLGEHFFAFVGLGWERNAFAGFNHRTVAVTGAGNQWGVDAPWTLKLGYGITYTVQRDVTPDPDRDRDFAGVRLTLDHIHPLTEGTVLEVNWVVDGNLQEFSDVRGDLVQAVSADLTSRLALKTSLQLKVDNDPPLEGVPLRTPDGEDTGERVLVPFRKVDRSISVALVITF